MVILKSIILAVILIPGISILLFTDAVPELIQELQGAVISPHTDLLFVSSYCGSCIQAKQIVKRIQKEGYDIEIIDIYEYRRLVVKHQIHAVPTLVIRDNGVEIIKRIGLLTEGEYRTLISRK